MAFRRGETHHSLPDTPEQLHRNLPRGPKAVPGLWTHQGDVLRAWHAEHQDSSDVALELPTGTGKTLPGLLIAEWVRLTRNRHVIYACPTQQLARQVFETARREGIAGSLLVGSHRDWPDDHHQAYVTADRIAITTYSSVFNISPKLEVPELAVFDDAHSGEQYVAGAYSVEIVRAVDEDTYSQVLAVLAPALDGIFIQRLENEVPDLAAQRQVRLVIPAQEDFLIRSLHQVLSRALTGDQSYRFSMIRSGLASCQVYINHAGILIRPLIPPTHENPILREARQRIYLSATLGHCGELERAFGRKSIVRLPLPDTSRTPRSGRRFFVFADLVKDQGSDSVTVEVARLARKALVIAPNRKLANDLSIKISNHVGPCFDSQNVDEALEQFGKATSGVCGLANRYDGIDLPGEACRLVVLEGLPDRTTLLERFLSGRARAATALAERVRTRVIQGAGRCTRGPGDLAVVVVRGPDLTKYLLNPRTREVMDPEIQAEIQFGIDNGRIETSELIANVSVFLDQGETWLHQAEDIITDLRQSTRPVHPEGSEALALSASLEVEASSEAWSGRWEEASRILQLAATALGEGCDSTRGYRAMLLYLAGVWSHRAGTAQNDDELMRVGRALVRRADQAARPAQWVKEMRRLSDEAIISVNPVDEAATRSVARELLKTTSAKQQSMADRMLAGLSQAEPSRYEPALSDLGSMIGAKAFKPQGDGRCDSVWRWNNDLWVAVEAKSGHRPGKLIPHRDIRQANDQLRLLREDLGASAIPEGSVTLLVSPRRLIQPSAIGSAEPHLFLVSPEEVVSVAEAAASAWKELLGRRQSLDEPSLRRVVLDCFRSHGVLPSQVVDQLTENPAGESSAATSNEDHEPSETAQTLW